MNFDLLAIEWPLYAHGAVVTLELLAISVLVGGAAAVGLAVLRVSPNPWVWRPVWLYTYVFRGTPMLVQLFLLYYGVAQFDVVRDSFAWPWLSSAWFCACAAFALNTCAYTTELLAGAMRTIPGGEIEAARAMGMTRGLLLRRIVLPAAWRRALPAYSNEVIMMLHGTSLASVVTLMDITGAARDVNSRYYKPFESFITAAAVYLVLTLVLVAAFHRIERYARPQTR